MFVSGLKKISIFLQNVAYCDDAKAVGRKQHACKSWTLAPLIRVTLTVTSEALQAFVSPVR